ncbi:hypothetical protein EMIT0P253_480019 [Pseudomonas sp. IT-P253]
MSIRPLDLGICFFNGGLALVPVQQLEVAYFERFHELIQCSVCNARSNRGIGHYIIQKPTCGCR